jgi:hypothetical protein
MDQQRSLTPPKRTSAATDEVPVRQIFPSARFSQFEDAKLESLVKRYGAHIMDTGHSGRQCRDRWNFYLSPKVEHQPMMSCCSSGSRKLALNGQNCDNGSQSERASL